MAKSKQYRELLKEGVDSFKKLLDEKFEELRIPKGLTEQQYLTILEDWRHFNQPHSKDLTELDRVRIDSVLTGYTLALDRVGLLQKVKHESKNHTK